MSACLFWELKVVACTGLHIYRMVRDPIMHGCRCLWLVVIDHSRRSCDYVLWAWILKLLLFVHHDVGSGCSWLFDEELARSYCSTTIVYLVDLICVIYDCLCRFIDDLTTVFARFSCTVSLLLLILNFLWCSLRIIYVELLWLGEGKLISGCLVLVIRRRCQRCTFSLVVWLVQGCAIIIICSLLAVNLIRFVYISQPRKLVLSVIATSLVIGAVVLRYLGI